MAQAGKFRSRAISIAVMLAVGGCRAGAPNDGGGANAAAPAPPSTEESVAPLPASVGAIPMSVPASYDWAFAARGETGSLAFGDGDVAAGLSLLRLTCRPLSNRIALSAGSRRAVTLRAGGQSVTAGDALPADHPVLRAFAGSGSVALLGEGAERVMTAKPGAGRIAVESFFAFCAAPPAPVPSAG